MKFLTPDYINVDFENIKSNIIETLKNDEVFKDYNYEGSNITLIIELLSYITELNLYYNNKIAENVFPDTVTLYENASRLAQWLGYYPRGYRSSQCPLTLSITQDYVGQYWEEGDELNVSLWTNFTGSIDDESVNFVSDSSFLTSPDNSTSYSFDIDVRQGVQKTYMYHGFDVIDNKIVLPNLKFDHLDPDSEGDSIWVLINDTYWERVYNFFEDYSEWQGNSNVYRLLFDKYKNYVIEFSSAHKVPKSTDEIRVFILETAAEEGNVASSTITTTPEDYIIYNTTKDINIPLDVTQFWNPIAAVGGSTFESIEEIKNNAKMHTYTQNRCVTSSDYSKFLETKSDIAKAFVWGQQEERSNKFSDINKIWIACIPDRWGTLTINVDVQDWELESGKSGTIEVPQSYAQSYKNRIKNYVEHRDIINNKKDFRVPDLVYFAFSIGLKTKNTYNFARVMNDITRKLDYYFSIPMQEFGTTIDFRDISEFIKDPNITAENDAFRNIRGIQHFTFREIFVSHEIGDYNVYYPENYPKYKYPIEDWYDNTLRPIVLWNYQFPRVKTNLCTFVQEG